MSSDYINYYKEITKYKVLSQEEFNSLFTKMLNNDIEARKIIIQSNLKLVVKIAILCNKLNFPIMDLIEEGNIGLIKALDRFDITKNICFSTYATYYIKNEILTYIAANSKCVKLSIGNLLTLNRIIKITETISSDNKDASEIIKKYNKLYPNYKITKNTYLELLKFIKPHISINKDIVSCNENVELVNSIVDIDSLFEDDLINTIYCEKIWNILEGEYDSILSLNEKKVLLLFLKEGLTAKEIKKELNMSLQDVLDYKSFGLKKLRFLLKN